MDEFFTKLRFFLKKLRSYFKESLPVGMKDFNRFYQEILELYSFPDDPSYKQAVAAQIMHFGPQTTRISKHFIAKTIKASQTKQISYAVIQELRELEKQKQKDEEAKKSLKSSNGEAAPNPTPEKAALEAFDTTRTNSQTTTTPQG